METIAIIGGTGQLGSELVQTFSDKRVLSPAHSELPIESAESVEAFLDQEKPAVLINCSAFHQVDQCESDPMRAFHLNATMVGNAAKATAARGIAFVTFSTDYVFSGTEGKPYVEEDVAEPQNVYGVSKLAGEHYARLANPRTFVIRISGVFGRTGYSNKGPTFIERMISMAERGEPIKVVDNIVFSPTYTVHTASAIRTIIEREEGGLFHLTNSGQCSWYDLAVEAITCAGLSANVERTKYHEAPGAIKRPVFSPLANAELQKRGYPDLPPWQVAVKEYVAQRKAAAT